MATKTKPITYLYIITAITLWGFSFIWTNELIRFNIPIFTFITMRMAIAGITLWIFSKGIRKLQKVAKKDMPALLLMVFCEPFIYFIGESYGLKYTNSPTISAVIVATIPLFTLVIGQVVFKEKLSKLNIAGIILTVPGILMMVMRDGDFTIDYWYGIILLFVAVFSAVGYSACVKKLTDKYNSFTLSTYQFLIGALMFLPLFLIFDLKDFSFSVFTPEVLKPLLSLALLCSCLSFVLYINAIKDLGITRTSVFSSLIPAVSATGAYFLGHETFNITQVLGIFVVMLGVIIAQFRKT